MSLSFRSVLSKILIYAGLAMMLTAAVYETVNYPWKTVFGGDDWQAEKLPEPGKLPPEIDIVPYDGEAQPDAPAGEDAPLMPGRDTLVTPAEFPGTAEQAPTPKPSPPPQAPAPALKPQYVLLGTFKIPKLDVSAHLFEGSEEQMRYGVGHVTGTALPGLAGNAVFGGHRSYIRMHPFRHLDKLKTDDKVTIAFGGHDFTYTVFDAFFVQPDETWVMLPIEGETYAATLITCDPVLRPTRRLIVRMRLTDIDGVAPDAFYAPPEASDPMPEPSQPDPVPELPAADSGVLPGDPGAPETGGSSEEAPPPSAETAPDSGVSAEAGPDAVIPPDLTVPVG